MLEIFFLRKKFNFKVKEGFCCRTLYSRWHSLYFNFRLLQIFVAQGELIKKFILHLNIKFKKTLRIHQSIQWFHEKVKKNCIIFIYLVYGQKAVTEKALLYSYLFVLDTTKILICLFLCNLCQTKLQIDF